MKINFFKILFLVTASARIADLQYAYVYISNQISLARKCSSFLCGGKEIEDMCRQIVIKNLN